MAYVRGMGRYRRGLGEVSPVEIAELMVIGGMGRYRGMGQIQGEGLNCPGDPGCPGANPMIQTPLTDAQIAALSASNAAYFAIPVTTAGTNVTSQTFTQWLNANATTVIIVAGAALALAMLK